MKQLSLGLTGLGGYAGWACDQMLGSAKPSTDHGYHARLTAVCEPDHLTHAVKIQSLRGLGITVVSKLDDLLALPIDGVWLPLPIDLHRPYTERALRAGKAVLVEKPAAGCVDDVDAMILAQQEAALPVAVGYQNLFDAATWTMKRRLLDGAIGKPTAASVVCCWPRSDAYFHRTAWAGKLKRNGAWVLDSPANNAMAHFLNLALFLLGPSESESTNPLAVEAELYRANPIENYDTCCLRYEIAGGATLLVGLTHACRRTVHPTVTITGECGTLRFWNSNRYEITRTSSDPQCAELTPESLPAAPHVGSLVTRGFAAYVMGDPSPQVATLTNARAHTVAVNGASEASPVRTIPASAITVVPGPDGHPLRSVAGIEDALLACAADGQMLHESGRVPWSAPAGAKDLRGYTTFTAPATASARANGVRELV